MKWNDVNQILPETQPNTDGVACAVVTENGNVYRSRYMHDVHADGESKYWSGFDVNDHGVEDEWYEINEKVAYWLPLPKKTRSETKYDWSNVLNHVKWIATDKDGYAWMYESKPAINYGSEKWEGSEEVIHFHPESTFTGDWKESLEQRPGEEDERTN